MADGILKDRIERAFSMLPVPSKVFKRLIIRTEPVKFESGKVIRFLGGRKSFLEEEKRSKSQNEKI